MPKHATPEVRFFRSIAPGDGSVESCWRWALTPDRDGYGQFRTGGRGSFTARAHRWAWEFFMGPIPDGLTVDHLCHTRDCVNVWHMDLVTNEENARRGRVRWGLRTHCSRGHEYTPSNVYIRPDIGTRMCRECDRLRSTNKNRTTHRTTNKEN